MAQCWSCGKNVTGYHYTCRHCENIKEIKRLQEKVESSATGIYDRLDYMVQVQQDGFSSLRTSLSEGLAEIAAVIEWGFEKLYWELHQQTEILRSIDHSLKTPSETQANEWRKIAEGLKTRNVLDQSEKFYLKALELNPLDYRLYVGLAQTYLQENKFNEAKFYLEQSLPHAPRGNQDETVAHIAVGIDSKFDWRSYSYRLIGHIHACDEDYNQAVLILRSAIELSPDYADGYYDYSKYCAQLKETKDCLFSLQRAILVKPLYWYLAQYDRNFYPIQRKISEVIENINTEALHTAKKAIAQSETAVRKADEMISAAQKALLVSKDNGKLQSSDILRNANILLKQAESKFVSGDYKDFLEIQTIAKECQDLANNATRKAHEERKHYEERRDQKVKNAKKIGLQSTQK